MWISIAAVSGALARGSVDVGGGPAGRLALEFFRIDQGVGQFGLDTDERTLPLDAGLTDALDLDKGCFPGQEVLARINNLGHPAHSPARFECVGAIEIEQGATVVGSVDGKTEEIGRVTSVASIPGLDRTVALGNLKWSHRDAREASISIGSGLLTSRPAAIISPLFKAS